MTDTTTAPEQQPSEHVDELCVQCEQTDNHPKVHVLQAVKREVDGVVAEGLEFVAHHLDCLPHHLRQQSIELHPHMASAYHAALHEGVHGDDLRAHIADIHAALDEQPEQDDQPVADPTTPSTTTTGPTAGQEN